MFAHINYYFLKFMFAYIYSCHFLKTYVCLYILIKFDIYLYILYLF